MVVCHAGRALFQWLSSVAHCVSIGVFRVWSALFKWVCFICETLCFNGRVSCEALSVLMGVRLGVCHAGHALFQWVGAM